MFSNHTCFLTSMVSDLAGCQVEDWIAKALVQGAPVPGGVVSESSCPPRILFRLCCSLAAFDTMLSVVGERPEALVGAWDDPLPPPHLLPMASSRMARLSGSLSDGSSGAFSGHVEAVRLGVERFSLFFKSHGLNVDAPDKNGAPATFRAVFLKDSDALFGLLAGGASPRATLRGRTLGEAAFSTLDEESLRVLALFGAPPPQMLFGPLSSEHPSSCSKTGVAMIADMERAEMDFSLTRSKSVGIAGSA